MRATAGLELREGPRRALPTASSFHDAGRGGFREPVLFLGPYSGYQVNSFTPRVRRR